MGLSFIIVVALSAVNAVGAFEVTATITLGNPGGYYGLAYDSAKGEIFVANGDFDSVSVISDSTNTVIANVTLESNPQGICYDSGKGEVFVTYSESRRISVISASSGTSASPSPTLPEFTSVAVLIVAAVTCLFALTLKK